jgi:hypothetical protein
MKILLVLFALAIGAPGQAFAEELAQGARVRVTLIDRKTPLLMGTVVGSRPTGWNSRPRRAPPRRTFGSSRSRASRAVAE